MLQATPRFVNLLWPSSPGDSFCHRFFHSSIKPSAPHAPSRRRRPLLWLRLEGNRKDRVRGRHAELELPALAAPGELAVGEAAPAALYRSLGSSFETLSVSLTTSRRRERRGGGGAEAPAAVTRRSRS